MAPSGNVQAYPVIMIWNATAPRGLADQGTDSCTRSTICGCTKHFNSRELYSKSPGNTAKRARWSQIC